jgi:Tfp pilus assembly protein PilF
MQATEYSAPARDFLPHQASMLAIRRLHVYYLGRMSLLSYPARWLLLTALPLIAAAQDHQRQGRDALGQGLWEVASHHFQLSLESKDLDPALKPEIAIRFAESSLRAGATDAALQILDESFLADHPETSFWKAQALLQNGRLTDALELFTPLLANPQSPHYAQSVFTATNIHLALARTQDALATLEYLSSSTEKDPISQKAALRRVEILLDTGNFAEARSSFPDPAALPPSLTMLARLLEGRILLGENQPQEAAQRFQGLLSAGFESNNRLFHLAAIGLCDSLTLQNKKQEALTFLLDFLQKNPKSPQLGPLFERLLPLLPQSFTPSDPAVELLLDWASKPPIPASGIIASWETGAEGALPGDTGTLPNQELTHHALYALAVSWLHASQPQITQQSRFFANRLLTEAPDHPLVSRLLLSLAKHNFTQGNTSAAFDQLDVLRLSTTDPGILGETEFLTARALYDKDTSAEAIQVFHQAADHLQQANSDAARFNAYLLEFIRMEEEPDAEPLSSRPVDPHLATDLALERALATHEAANRRQLLEAFLSAHPDHPRIGEARLAAADAALATSPPDLSFAKAQIDTIGTLPDEQKPEPSRITLVEIRVLDRKGDHAAVIQKAAQFIDSDPESTDAAEVIFLLGKNLYQSGRYNDARLALERLAHTEGESDRAQASWLLAARAAALVATQQSRQEAVIIFDKAITAPGPLSSVARLEKARLLVDMNRPQEAQQLLGDWFSLIQASDPIHLPAGFLLAEAIRAQGHPKALENALAIYDQLIESAKSEPSAYHRLQYLRGLTFEQMGTPESPAQKRIREAFVAYYSVLETETPPAEWYYFELCGFKALGMLIDSGRWPAAIACARRIASFQGPRAKEAEEIASQLQLKHQVWED